MRRISPEAVNSIIEECKTENDDKIKIPRTPTYREDAFLDYNAFIDRQADIENLMRQTLPFFANNPDMDFPFLYFMYTGEKESETSFKTWTQNRDDVARLTLLAMYSGIISGPKKIITKDINGENTEVLSHRLVKRLKPAIVRQGREPDEK